MQSAYRVQKLYNLRMQTATSIFKKSTRFSKKIFKDSNPFLLSCPLLTLIVMARGEQGKSTRLNRDCTKARKGITAPISLKDLTEKEAQSSLQHGAIRELSVLADP